MTFYHQDWIGSVVLLTDALGAKVQTYTYDAWGKPNGFDAPGVGIPPASFASRFLYTGREYDIETALYHYRARAYSPTLGRFLQLDPIDFCGGDGNLSLYVGNNPMNFWDPYGMWPENPYGDAFDAELSSGEEEERGYAVCEDHGRGLSGGSLCGRPSAGDALGERLGNPGEPETDHEAASVD